MQIRLPPGLRHRLQRSHEAGPVLLAVLVGLLAGGWEIVFRWLIDWAHLIFFQGGSALVAHLSGPTVLKDLDLLLIPVVGMALTVWITIRWAPEARGHGVPEVQHAVRVKGGRIRSRVAVVKAVASAICIGSGGSVGREGAIVQIGSALGSTAGLITGLGPEQVKLLVACGAAGAIGATFNAPIAGVLFALEIILGSFAARSFGLVVIASVSATALSQAVLGPEPAFHLVQPFTLVSDRELPLYLVLGLLMGGVGVLYVRSVYGFEDAFERWKVPRLLKGVVGGVGIGVIGFFGSRLVFGASYEGVEHTLAGDLTIRFMLLLLLLKLVATSLTLAAGGSGGVFAPALFMGAMAGGAYGQLVHGLFPTWTAPSGAYALVGMAALFGGAAHAPITSIVILFEMTDNYRIILPLMLAVVISYLVATRTWPDSIYSVKLRRLGQFERPDREISVLDMLLVADAMMEEFETVKPDLSLEAFAERARSHATRSWPVVDERGDLVGIVTGTDLEGALLDRTEARLTVGEIMTTSVLTLQPGDTLREAFRRFAERDVSLIPVVADAKGRQLCGVLRRHEMMWAYQALSEEHDRLLKSANGRAGEAPSVAVQLELEVPPDDGRLAGRRLREITFPDNVLVTLIRRGGRSYVPRGNTKLEAGDLLHLVTTKEEEETVRRWVSSMAGSAS
ncbi:MAG: chloride channel protein [Gemmatimonadota bacterium]